MLTTISTSAIAPPVPPWAIAQPTGATILRPCRRPSTPASRTGIGAHRAGRIVTARSWATVKPRGVARDERDDLDVPDGVGENGAMFGA